MYFFRCIPLLGLLLTLIFTANINAGVITVVGGVVTEATLSDGTQNITVKFVSSPYNNLSLTDVADLQASSWWTNSTSNRDDARNLAIDLAATMDSSTESITTHNGSRLQYYVFATFKSSYVQGIIIDYTGSTTGWEQRNPTNIGLSEDIIYAIETTTVPEPSTAIAMGLLGIVGFAGNRRRRRQGSVA